MEYECALRVRSYECDIYGHVNNAVYLNYLEYARGEFLKSIEFPYLEAISSGYGLYVARIAIDYKSPAFPEDELCIRTKALKKGAVSGVLSQVIVRGETVIVTAEVTWAFVDSKGTPTRIPKEWDLPGLKA
ncbi:MAG: thioesterase family protein [Treponemataceae bacterium]